MIHREAVEAAAKASFQFLEDQPWEAASPEETDFFRDAARKVLTSAAPHFAREAKAEAWEEAYALGWADGRVQADPLRTNPYKEHV